MSCAARRASSSGVNGAATKPSRSLSIASRACAKARSSPAIAARSSAAKSRSVRVARSRAALRLVLGREDQPVAAHERRRLGRGWSEAALELACGFVEVVREPCLVGVEQVLAHLGNGIGRLDLAGRERVERDRGVDAGTGEARRRAKVADQEPASGGASVAASRGRRGRGERGPPQRRGDPAADAGEFLLRALRRGVAGPVEQERGLGVEQRRADLFGRLPRRGRARAARKREDGDRRDERRDGRRRKRPDA